MSKSPSERTDPRPVNQERMIDGLLRSAANLAPAAVGGDVGDQLRIVFWSYYNTPDALIVSGLARAVIERAGVNCG